MLIGISIGAFCATLLGGLFAIKFRDKLHLVLGFSAGAVIGVAFFDLLPEALALGGAYYESEFITTLVAAGFMLFMILDRFVIFHSHSHDDHNHNLARGYLGAGSLAIHSFLDGLAIGLAFQVSPIVGMTVATAVLVHNFSDGINATNMIIKQHGTKQEALRWLALASCAPVLGIMSTYFFTLPEQVLGIMLALFCGFFIYIGASDLLPESHHAHPTRLTTVVTLLGIGILYIAISLAHI